MYTLYFFFPFKTISNSSITKFSNKTKYKEFTFFSQFFLVYMYDFS